jgi:serine O-acetyltransferase
MARSCGDGMIFRNFVTVGVQKAGEQGPTIGDYVQFGTGCKVLGDITIGSNVLIGANAVVVKDVPPNSVVAGIPAKVIRRTKDRWGTPFDEDEE